MKRLLIIFLLIFAFFSMIFARDFIFFGNLSGRIIPENNSCFLRLAEYLHKNSKQDAVLIDLGNSLYGSEQSVYYLLNESEEFKKFISDFYSSNSIIKCIGEKDLYVESLLKGLKLFSGNVFSNFFDVANYLLDDDFVFVPLSLLDSNLIFKNFQIAEPFEALSNILDSLNITENDAKIVVVGISNSQNVNIGSIIEKLDSRVDFVIFQSEFSGVFDVSGKKAFALSDKDVLRLRVDDTLEYHFELLPEVKTKEFTQELEKINSWLEKELAIFMYEPRDYGFDDLNLVNTTAEFLARSFSKVENSVPLFVFDKKDTKQKIQIKDVLQMTSDKTIYRARISGKELEKLISDLLENNFRFETENINYIAQINDAQPLKWFRYRGKPVTRNSSFELITNVPVSSEIKFEVLTQEFLDILKRRVVSIKYVKNWYVIDSPFVEEFRYYVVDWADSIGVLSLIFNKDQKLLMDINGIEDPRNLMVGSVLIIPMF